MDDFSGVFSGITVADGIAAIIGAGALIVAVDFARWLTNIVAEFFDSGNDEEVDYYEGGWTEDCVHCGFTMDEDEAIYAHHSSGVCPKCGESV